MEAKVLKDVKDELGKEDQVKARDNWHQFHEAYENGHRGFVKKAKRNNNFYMGEQWDAADKSRLDREGRPALTLNLVLSTVNAIIGEQLDRKVDPIFTADIGGEEQTAFALNKITRGILNRNTFDDLEEDVFADGIITGRGYYDIRMDFSKNLQGEICITGEDPVDVVLDSGAKEYDPKTWSRVFVSRWMTVDRVGELYGWDKAEEIRKVCETGTNLSDDNFDFYDQTYGGGKDISHTDTESRRIRRVRVIEQQYYMPAKIKFFVDLRTGDLRQVPQGAEDEAVEAFAQEYELGLIERMGRRVYMRTTVDDVLLKDGPSLYRSFTIVPFFPYFRRGHPFGVVDNLIDPQNLLNKTSSQELHIVNTTANSGWMIEEDSLVDMDAEDLEERGAETGLVLQYKRNRPAPEKIQPNQIPTGIDRISQKAANTVREVSGVNASMLGAARADMSGVAQERSTQRGQVQVSVLLSNLRRARTFVLEKIFELVQDFYTETRYYTVVGDSLMMNEREEEQVAINVPQDDGSILNDVTIGNYSIEVGYRASGGSRVEQELEEALRLRELGVAIPDHVVVQYSSLTKRKELADHLKNSQGFGEPTEQEILLQDLETEHAIGRLKRELEQMDADIEVAIATAAEKMAKAKTLEGYNQADMEVRKLEQAKEEKQQELALRVALAARTHQNQSSQNDKRLASQMAMKAMDIGAAAQQKPPEKEVNPKPKK